MLQDIDNPKYNKIDTNSNHPLKRKYTEGNGSTISILGLWPYEDVEIKMVKSAINNFWMAILDDDLIVQVNDTIINGSNIENLIEKHLPERAESSRTKSNPTKYGRARCYFETWTEKCQETTEVYAEQIPILGRCILKISQHREYPGKVAFLRKQKMLIVRSSINVSVRLTTYCNILVGVRSL